jgi:hypothetical protein
MMDLSGETEICGLMSPLLRDADAETSKSTSRRRIETIEKFLKAAYDLDDRTVPLGECLRLAVDALEGT